MKTPTEALANHLQMDYYELKDYRYHYGHTSIPVYALEKSYYCCTRGSKKPATHRSGMEWNWIEVKNDFINKFGYRIWETNN